MISTPTQRLAHAASRAPTLRLVDGPLAITGDRFALVRKMADELVRFDAWRNADDARRVLIGRYPSLDIVKGLDDTRQLAMQDVVAREMSKR